MSKKKLPSAAVAARYGKSQKTLDRWTELGIIPRPKYINGYKFWDEEELDAADAAREQGSPRISTNVGARSKGNSVDPPSGSATSSSPAASAEQRKTENAALDREVAS